MPFVALGLGNGGLSGYGWRVSGERGERRAQGCIGRRDAVIALAMQARRPDEGGEPVAELAGSGPQVCASIGAGLGQVVDELLRADGLQVLQGEWAMAQ